MRDLGHDKVEDLFRDEMASAGVPYSGTIHADGQRHRVYVEGDKKGSQNGWYILHSDGVPAGAFGSWRTGVTQTWRAQSKPAPDWRHGAPAIDRRRRRREAEERQEEARQASAASKASSTWSAAGEADPGHPYLQRKGIGPHGVRQGTWIKERMPGPHGECLDIEVRNTLFVPVLDGREVVNLQAIFSQEANLGGVWRDKDFIFGGKKKGCAFPIGIKPKEIDGSKVVLVCEGFATAASLHESTGHAVLAAFDAGNLVHVARKVRLKSPTALIVLAADNDCWTKSTEGIARNVGVEKAKQAADAVGGVIAIPQFADPSGRPTDFNDLHQREGPAVVAAQVNAAIDNPDVTQIRAVLAK